MTRELREHFGDDLRYVVLHLPLPDVHPHAEAAAMAAEAAGAQGHFWDMHDTLFAHQDQLEIEDLLDYANDLELDLEQFARDLDAQTARRVREESPAPKPAAPAEPPPSSSGPTGTSALTTPRP